MSKEATARSAMKLALEALAVKFSEGWHEGIKIDASDIMLLNDAAQALAEPDFWEGYVPEPVSEGRALKLAMAEANDKRLEAQQEPVCIGWDDKTDTPIMGYTSPPAQRTWVGLTDEERDDILDIYITAEGRARAIEHKLKEKNT